MLSRQHGFRERVNDGHGRLSPGPHVCDRLLGRQRWKQDSQGQPVYSFLPVGKREGGTHTEPDFSTCNKCTKEEVLKMAPHFSNVLDCKFHARKPEKHHKCWLTRSCCVGQQRRVCVSSLTFEQLLLLWLKRTRFWSEQLKLDGEEGKMPAATINEGSRRSHFHVSSHLQLAPESKWKLWCGNFLPHPSERVAASRVPARWTLMLAWASKK